MWKKLVIKRVKSGFPIIELLTVMSMMAVLAAIAIPALSLWIPNYHLKSAARDLYSNFQLAKITAVKQNEVCAVVFDSGITPGRYFICSGPGANGNWDGPPRWVVMMLF